MHQAIQCSTLLNSSKPSEMHKICQEYESLHELLDRDWNFAGRRRVMDKKLCLPKGKNRLGNCINGISSSLVDARFNVANKEMLGKAANDNQADCIDSKCQWQGYNGSKGGWDWSCYASHGESSNLHTALVKLGTKLIWNLRNSKFGNFETTARGKERRFQVLPGSKCFRSPSRHNSTL